MWKTALPPEMTLRELRALMEAPKTKQVLVQVRFGHIKDWIRITKAEARYLLELVDAQTNEKATAKDCGMEIGVFGSFNAGMLYFGG